MRFRIITVVLLASLGFASNATANTNSIAGTFTNDRNARITMDVVVHHGVPVKVENATFSRLDYICEDGSGAGQGGFSFGPILIEQSRTGVYRFEGSASEGTVDFAIGGTVTHNGTRVHGGALLRFYSAGDEHLDCGTYLDRVGEYRAR